MKTVAPAAARWRSPSDARSMCLRTDLLCFLHRPFYFDLLSGQVLFVILSKLGKASSTLSIQKKPNYFQLPGPQFSLSLIEKPIVLASHTIPNLARAEHTDYCLSSFWRNFESNIPLIQASSFSSMIVLRMPWEDQRIPACAPIRKVGGHILM